jgi:hypothetical protein
MVTLLLLARLTNTEFHIDMPSISVKQWIKLCIDASFEDDIKGKEEFVRMTDEAIKEHKRKADELKFISELMKKNPEARVYVSK